MTRNLVILPHGDLCMRMVQWSSTPLSEKENN